MSDDDSLKEYEKKRDLNGSPEPEVRETATGPSEPVFVIQKHDASTLHYDFRLEIDGALKSWSVPKGPSTDPSDKRLAIPTEDHPMDYADFEGVIPEDEYGAGTVMIWDRGTYENLRRKKEDDGPSMSDAYSDGKIEVRLNGQKISGGYALIKTGREDNWLLIKMDDDQADARRNPVSTEPKSVVSGRTIDEIETEEDESG